ncbi:MAG: ATP-binding protein [Treponema sp.]|nr:ATP-binding protein [Treponema sp.]
MPIRIRVILVIFLTTLVIITFSILVGVFTVRSGIERSQETDLILISEIADHFISSEVKALKLKVSVASQVLSSYGEHDWDNALIDLRNQYPDFTGMSVWDNEQRLIASAGMMTAVPRSLGDRHLQEVLKGNVIITSTAEAPTGLAFHLAALLDPEHDAILTLTLPITYFSDILINFRIWRTGHIFMDNSNGHLIADPVREWVENRIDFVNMAEMDLANRTIVNNLRQAFDSEARTITYSIGGVPRLTVYRPISGSDEGWLLGAVAPLPESPFLYIDRGLIVVGLVSLFLSLIAAIAASGFIKKPFEKIAALKEEAEANSRFKSDFLANMSHEIRTPMNTIIGVAEIIMRDDTISKNTRDGLNRIYSSGDLLLNIINDILDMSKIEAGKLDLTPYIYESASLINDTATLNMVRLGSKEIEFKIEVDENIPQVLFGDEIRIKQILNNLLSNAFKYTDKGEVKLSFAIEREIREKKNEMILVLCVSDTGQGMTPDQVSSLFNQYSRFNLEANRSVEGTGLGMSITHNLISLMDGKIIVESESGKGSVFTVRLPQGFISDEILGKELAENLEAFRLGGITQIRKAQIVYEPMPYGSVLIVDDVESNLFVAKGLLMPWELSIDTVRSGFEAIDKIKTGKVYDIIFMDHMMPKMDGVEAVKKIRNMGYTHPIVTLTANAVKEQQEMFLANGFDDFISKPIDIRRLNTVLKKYVRDKQPAEVLEDVRLRYDNREIGYTADDEQTVKPQLAEFFVRDALLAISVLEELHEKESYSDEDMYMYTTSVHALKSALGNVGENKLSAFAGKLEEAGINREIAVISAETGGFITELKEVVEKLRPINDEGNEAAEGDIKHLHEKLNEIKNSCRTIDRKAVKEAIIELRQGKWPDEVNELLTIMHEHLLSGNFNNVSSVADKIMRNN